jgi:hypothetical protein
MSKVITISGLSKKFFFAVKDSSAGWFNNFFYPQTKEVTAAT